MIEELSSLKMLIIIVKGGRRVYLDCQVSLVHETAIFSGKFILNIYYAIVYNCYEGKNMLFPHQDNSYDSVSHGRRERSEVHAKGRCSRNNYIVITVS